MPLSRALIALALLLPASAALGASLTAKQIYERTKDSVVSIEVETADGDYSGTGFFYIDGRTVATALHVVKDATKIEIRGRNGKVWRPIAVRTDASADTALLILAADSGRRPIPHAPSASIGVGDPIYVIGDPLGLTSSLSTGVVGAFRNSHGVPLVQFTASISQGSSGSPVLDKMGRAIGIVSFTYSDGQNLNMAIASKVAKGLKDSGKNAPLKSLGGGGIVEAQATNHRVIGICAGHLYANFYQLVGLWTWYLTTTYNDTPGSPESQKTIKGIYDAFQQPLLEGEQKRFLKALGKIDDDAGIEILRKRLEALSDASTAAYNAQIKLAQVAHGDEKAYSLALDEIDRRQGTMIDLVSAFNDWICEQKWCDADAFDDAMPSIVSSDWRMITHFKAQVQFLPRKKFEVGVVFRESQLQLGDQIVALGLSTKDKLEPVSNWGEFSDYFDRHGNGTYKIQVKRNGEVLTFTEPSP